MKYSALEVDDSEDVLETIPEQSCTTPSKRRPSPPPSAAVATRRQERLLILASMAGFFMIVGALSLHNPETSTPDFTDNQALRGSPGPTSLESHSSLDLPEEINPDDSSSSLVEKMNLNKRQPCNSFDGGDCKDKFQQERLFDDDDLFDTGTLSPWSEAALDGLPSESFDNSSMDDSDLSASLVYENDDALEETDVTSSQDETLEDDDENPSDEAQKSNSEENVIAGGNDVEEHGETSTQEAARAEDLGAVARIEDEKNHGH